MRKVRTREGKKVAPSHTAYKEWSWGSNPRIPRSKILLYAAPTDHAIRGHLIQKENIWECKLHLILHIKYRKSQQLFTLLNGRERILLLVRKRWKGTFIQVIISISVIPNIIILWERITLMTSCSQPSLIKQEPTQISVHQNASFIQLLKLYFWKKRSWKSSCYIKFSDFF